MREREREREKEKERERENCVAKFKNQIENIQLCYRCNFI